MIQANRLTVADDIVPAFITRAFDVAISAAEAWRGSTAPNPPVGCVILDETGETLAVAAHQRAGEGHAEALAIAECRRAGTVNRIHNVVVTLEPCNHTGRTPPCSEAILATPARQVWIGAADPNPRVAGGGAQRLQAAGLDVHLAEDDNMRTRCKALIAPFTKRATTGLPWVTVKQALDVQGSMIPPAGQKTFTSQKSLVLAHQLRRRADAILTGSGTVIADDPSFTVRHVEDFNGKRRQLLLLDRRERVPQSYFHATNERGFEVSRAATLETALQSAAQAGALEVLVEAGPQITSAILATELWDEHVIIRQTESGIDNITTHLRQHDTKGSHVLRHHQ
jgi:diaminohydroxyphosphoribosylaminopyrimidine deaminase / 5-amino-6-(5-phosphoribosylamino)uracil reductase